MTVGELEERMTARERAEWLIEFEIREEERLAADRRRALDEEVTTKVKAPISTAARRPQGAGGA